MRPVGGAYARCRARDEKRPFVMPLSWTGSVTVEPRARDPDP